MIKYLRHIELKHINNVDNAYDSLLFIVFLNFFKITSNLCLFFYLKKK